MKTLVIINEPLAKMEFGRNTTLAYICSCLKEGHDVYIHNLPKEGEVFAEKIDAIHLNKNPEFCDWLIDNYMVENDRIARGENPEPRAVGEVLREAGIASEQFPLRSAEFIIQRLEPMKAPFPPEGTKNIDEALTKLKEIFPLHIFNCPVGLRDKQTPQDLNKLLGEEIAIPTAEFTLEDGRATTAIATMKSERQRVVLKPKNSAQSLGVFAIEFAADGFDLATIGEISAKDLAAQQLYKIKPDADLNQITKILCFAQAARTDERKIRDITPEEISATAKKLYDSEILAQPFLEGVRRGDIRANFIKDQHSNFYLAGAVFRKSNHPADGADFTTCFTSGAATACPITDLPEEERENLLAKSEKILAALNHGELRKKYKDSIEIGADFLLVGDGRDVLLGEMNHHCPALLPLGEAMAERSGFATFKPAPNYGGGLTLATHAIDQQLEMQDRTTKAAEKAEAELLQKIVLHKSRSTPPRK